MSRKTGLVIWLAGWTLGGTVPTPALGAPQSQDRAQREWRNSPHAGSMDTPDERERMNRAGCAHCHTAQGYHEMTLAGLASSAPYSDPVGLTCLACHAPGEAPDDAGPLRAGAPRKACLGCHDELVSNTPDDLSWCSQEGVFNGTGGAEIPGLDYSVATHAGLEDGCVTCHMAPAAPGLDPGALGGHTFRVKTKGESPILFNPGPCQPCHGEMTLESVTASQEEVQGLLADLAGLLPQKPVLDEPAATEPRYPSDPSLGEIQARASYNYWLIQKDGSLGVHNPIYTRALLEHSIAELRARSH